MFQVKGTFHINREDRVAMAKFAYVCLEHVDDLGLKPEVKVTIADIARSQMNKHDLFALNNLGLQNEEYKKMSKAAGLT